MSEYCVHCLPTKRRNHFKNYFEYYFVSFVDTLLTPMKYISRNVNPARFTGGLIEFFARLGIVTFVQDPDCAQLNNRALVGFHAAKKRGLRIEAVRFFNTYFNEFRFFYNTQWHYYTSIPTTILWTRNDMEMDDKAVVKQTLANGGVPVAHGAGCKTLFDARAFAAHHGFPLVVKPLDGSSSMHVTFPIHSHDELTRAVEIAREYSPEFLVERYLRGRLYRGTVVGKKYVFVCEKERTHVVGDGISQITQLIEEKNTDPRRAPAGQKSATLRKIPVDQRVDVVLKKQNFTRDTIPAHGEKVYLHEKCLIGLGCDLIGHTEHAHPANKELFLRIATLFDTDLIGIDLICDDIQAPYDPENSGILEVNGLPHVDLHVQPSVGPADDIGTVIWDTVFARLDQNAIKSI